LIRVNQRIAERIPFFHLALYIPADVSFSEDYPVRQVISDWKKALHESNMGKHPFGSADFWSKPICSMGGKSSKHSKYENMTEVYKAVWAYYGKQALELDAKQAGS